MKKRLVLILVLALLVTACAPQELSKEIVKRTERIQDIDLVTADNVNIKGTYYPGNDKGVILLHMLGKDRSTWNAFALELQRKGYSVIAIDFRGHGESELNYKDFTSSDYNMMVNDVLAAKNFLLQKNVTKFAIVGASIGANVALNYAVTDDDIKVVVLMSPGLEYKDVSTIESSTRAKQRIIFIVASFEDSYSAESSQDLAQKVNATLKIAEGAGHGTQMLTRQDISDMIVGWLESSLV